MTPMHRVVIYVPKEDYKRLRVKLLEEGKTASAWFREKVREHLKLTNLG